MKKWYMLFVLLCFYVLKANIRLWRTKSGLDLKNPSLISVPHAIHKTSNVTILAKANHVLPICIKATKFDTKTGAGQMKVTSRSI